MKSSRNAQASASRRRRLWSSTASKGHALPVHWWLSKRQASTTPSSTSAPGTSGRAIFRYRSRPDSLSKRLRRCRVDATRERQRESVLGDNKIAEVSVLRRGSIRPEHENRAAVLRGVRPMHLAGLDVQRRAGLVFLPVVG